MTSGHRLGAQSEVQHLSPPPPNPPMGLSNLGHKPGAEHLRPSPPLRSPRPGGSDQCSWAAQL